MVKQKRGKQEKSRMSLGQYLRALRERDSMSLRDVEEKSGKTVSNAYLSQIEHDKIKQPSPAILHSLSEVYDVDYMDLMDRAGYLNEATPKGGRGGGSRAGRVPARSLGEITHEEEEQLLEYLNFLRSKKR